MAEFDPKAFLADPPATEFDPKAFLAGGDTPAEPALTREQEIRQENLKKLVAMHAAQPNQGFSAYTNRLKDAWTSGLARPMGAAMTTVGGEIGELFGGRPATVGERWRGGIGAEEDYAKLKEKESEGLLGTGVSVLGSLASGGRATGPKPFTLKQEALRAGAQGGIEGGARNAESVGNAVTGAGTGAAVGAGVTGVVGGLLDRLKRVGTATRDIGEASREGNSLQKAIEGGAIFDKLDAAGMHFSGKETPALANHINAVTSGPLPQSVRGEVDELVQDVNRRVANGAMTFGDVRAIQSDVSKLIAHQNPQVRAVAKDMSRGIDDFLQNAKPTMPASSVGTVGPNDLKEARKLYAVSKQGAKIEGMAEAATSHTDDPARATANKFKSYQDKYTQNPSKPQPSPEQKRLIDSIVETGRGGKGAAILDKYSNIPLGAGGLGAAAGGAGMVGFGDKDVHNYSGSTGGAGATLLALGLLGKGAAGGMRNQLAHATADKVDDLLRNVFTGSTTKGPNVHVPRDALAILLAKQDLARGVGKAVTSNIDTE